MTLSRTAFSLTDLEFLCGPFSLSDTKLEVTNKTQDYCLSTFIQLHLRSTLALSCVCPWSTILYIVLHGLSLSGFVCLDKTQQTDNLVYLLLQMKVPAFAFCLPFGFTDLDFSTWLSWGFCNNFSQAWGHSICWGH